MNESIFKIWETNRKIYLDFFSNYDLNQLNKIPAGFKNNLIWNIGHIIVAQQSLVYRLSGLEMLIPEDLFNLYKTGTVPSGTTTKAEAEVLKDLLISLIAKTKEDFANGKFVKFTERTTSTGFHLANVQDALVFNNYHEGMHLGIMMSIRKLI